VLANFSPGLFQPWVKRTLFTRTLKEFRAQITNTFSVFYLLTFLIPGLKQPWAEISQRFQGIHAAGSDWARTLSVIGSVELFLANANPVATASGSDTASRTGLLTFGATLKRSTKSHEATLNICS
jgi:hypothetical protein